jgi:hypothetical protein
MTFGLKYYKLKYSYWLNYSPTDDYKRQKKLKPQTPDFHPMPINYQCPLAFGKLSFGRVIF